MRKGGVALGQKALRLRFVSPCVRERFVARLATHVPVSSLLLSPLVPLAGQRSWDAAFFNRSVVLFLYFQRKVWVKIPQLFGPSVFAPAHKYVVECDTSSRDKSCRVGRNDRKFV